MNKRERLALMGQKVVVTAVLERVRTGSWDDPTWTWEPKAVEPRTGWVTGFRHKQIGSVEYTSYDEATVWQSTGNVPAVLVTFWPTTAPVAVPMDGYRLATADDPAPISPAAVFPYDKAYRQILREEALKQPRVNGRFAKLTPELISPEAV